MTQRSVTGGGDVDSSTGGASPVASVINSSTFLVFHNSSNSIAAESPPLFIAPTPAAAFDNASGFSPSSLFGTTSDGNEDFYRNSTAAASGDSSESVRHVTLQTVFLGLLAGTISLVTITGNLVVIASFILERTIRQPTNYFIASLAVSDLLIGSISMPFYTIYLLSGKYWPLGEVLCDLWLSLDYSACLVSIYTVFCITIDRFCSVKIPAKYRNWRTERKVRVQARVWKFVEQLTRAWRKLL